MDDECWQGCDASSHYGLEMQFPYSQHLLSGRKTIETRGYALPTPLLTKVDKNDESSVEIRIDVLESEKGQDGVSSIPDTVAVLAMEKTTRDQPFLKRKGWCTFVESFRYKSREQFEADEHKHLVPPTSRYGWDDERPIYGWVVGTCGYYVDIDGHVEFQGQRCMRSLFKIQKK